MKIQIISKLHNNQHHLNTHLSQQSKRTLNLNTDYYQHISPNNKPLQTLSANHKESIAAFFNQMHSINSLKYDKVQIKQKMPPFKRKILFFQKQKMQNVSNDYEFSFKKKDNTKPNTDHKEKLKTQNIYVNTASSNIILFPPSSPKASPYLHTHLFNSKTSRSRKFNSLATFSSDSGRNSQLIHAHGVHGVHGVSSVARKDNSLNKVIKFEGKRIENHKTQASQMQYQNEDYNAEEMKVDSKKMNAQINFEDQKQRLSRIRRQLNDIYQMKKITPHFKLKLY